MPKLTIVNFIFLILILGFIALLVYAGVTANTNSTPPETTSHS